MPDWDADSPRLRTNLAQVLSEIVRSARLRERPAIDSARRWHRLAMKGLQVPGKFPKGVFRGERGLENVQVRVGLHLGLPAANVAKALAIFETRIEGLVAELDATLPAGEEPTPDQLAAIVDLSAWVHAEWIRIHPFVNGNGRTAHLWANWVVLRYGLPPFIRLRPRPNSGYGAASSKAMEGDWQATTAVFRRLLEQFVAEL